MILAVGDVDPAIVVDLDVVDDVELAVPGARFAPREEELAVGRILVHPGVGIAVGHVEFSGALVKGHVGGNAEGFAAHLRAGLVGGTQGHQQLAVGRELPDGAVAVVHAEDGVVRRDGHAVGVANTPSPHVRSRLPSVSNTSIGIVPRLKT